LRDRLHPRIRTYGSTVDIFAFKGNINVRMRRMCRHDPERGKEEIKYKSFRFVSLLEFLSQVCKTYQLQHSLSLIWCCWTVLKFAFTLRERRAGSFILPRSLDSTCCSIHSLIAVGTAMNLPGVLSINMAE
jgi:hypothetical protein